MTRKGFFRSALGVSGNKTYQYYHTKNKGEEINKRMSIFQVPKQHAQIPFVCKSLSVEALPASRI